MTSYRDGMGNRVDLFNVTKPYRELVILATSYVRTHRRPGAARLDGGRARRARSALTPSNCSSRARWSTVAEALDDFVADPAPAVRGDLAGRLGRGDDGGGRRPAQVRAQGHQGPDPRQRGPGPGPGGLPGLRPPLHRRLPGARPARPLRQRLRQPSRRTRHPRLVPGLGRRRGRLGRRRPDPRQVRRRRLRRHRRRPRLLRRPPQPRPLEGPGRGDDRRLRQGRAGRPRPDGVERVVPAPIATPGPSPRGWAT